MSASTINLAVIPGDGIGPEVIAEALKVLEKAVAAEGVDLEQTHYKLGAQHWLDTGETLPDEVLADLRTRDAILFGAVGAAPGDTRIPSGIIEREMLLKLRFSLDHYVNLRPSRLYGTRGQPAGQPRRPSTSSWSAKAPKAPMSATAARCGPVRRMRLPPRFR